MPEKQQNSKFIRNMKEYLQNQWINLLVQTTKLSMNQNI